MQYKVRPYVRGVAGVAILFVVAAAGVYANNLERQAARVFFASALKTADIHEDVSIDGVTYDVRDGTVYQTSGAPAESAALLPALSLAYEKTLARRAPLFHLAGTNLDQFEVVIDSLEKSEPDLSEKQSSADARRRVSALFPVDFLRAVTALERTRRLFLQSGSRADADNYRVAFEKTLAAYKRSLTDFSRNFESSVPATRPPFVSGSIVVHRDALLQTAASLQEQALNTEREARARLLCVNGGISYCSKDDLAVPTVPIVEEEPDASAGLAHFRMVQSVRKNVGLSSYEDTHILAPNESACVPPNWNVPLYFGFTPDIKEFHGIQYSQPGFIGDTFLLEEKGYTDVAFFEALAAHGIQYVLSQPLAYYKCIELDRELGTITAMRDAYEFADTAHLSAYATGSDKQALTESEQLLAGQIVTERSVTRYLDAAQKLVGEQHVPEDVKNTIIELSLEVRDKSAGTYGVALNAAFLTEMTFRLSTEGIPTDLSDGYLFYARSGFPALYMANNPSATGHYPQQFKENTISREEQPYILLSDLLSTLPSNPVLKKQIVHDVQTWISIH